MTFLVPELDGHFRRSHLFEDVSRQSGQTVREVKDRRTFRFEVDGRGYFAKVHLGVGWGEILKNVLQLKLPVLGAANEFEAVNRIHKLGIDTLTPVAFEELGVNPATRRSCLVTTEIHGCPSLEEMVLAGEIGGRLRRRLVRKIAQIVRTIHEAGVNHRDLYICHFLLDPATSADASPRLFLIDLHRAQLRRGEAPARWREKDVAALLFSSADAGLNRGDIMTFVRLYSGIPARQSLTRNAGFWKRVVERAARLYRKEHGKPSVLLEQLGEP